MLYATDSGKVITAIPHKAKYTFWKQKITLEDYERVKEALNAIIDDTIKTGKEIMTSSWIPGSDWGNTVYEPIYIACEKDKLSASLFFGLILWEVFMNRKEYWAFGRYKRNSTEIIGMTYFRIEEP